MPGMAGDRWRDALDVFGDRVPLVHVKDIAAGQCVPFGQGECDLASLVATMAQRGYDGGYVVEIEGPMRQDVLPHLRNAVTFFRELGCDD